MSEIKNESVNFKYWDEMTPEERVQFDLDMWTDKKPDEGGPECVIKFLPLEAAALRTTIQTLDSLSDAMALDAEKHDIRNEWECLEANYLLELLKLRSKSDAGEIRIHRKQFIRNTRGINMTIQEVNELVLSKVPEEKKEAFIEAISACRSKSDKLAVLKKFDIQLTEKELEEISSSKVADEDLDLVTGGCDADCCDPYFSPSLKS